MKQGFRVLWFTLKYVASAQFLPVLFDRRTRFSYGHYSRHNGDKVAHYFSIAEICLEDLTIAGLPILESLQAQRVREVMSGLTHGMEQASLLYGRELRRTVELLEARNAGRDQFVLLVTKSAGSQYDIDDGATRASVLALSGAKNAAVVVAARV